MKKINGKIKLGVLLLAIPLLVWFAGLKTTVNLWMDCRNGKRLLEQLRFKEGEPANRRSIGEFADNADRPETAVSWLDSGKLLEEIGAENTACGVNVVRYTPWLTREEKDIKIYTGELVLSGRFVPLLRVIRSVENRCRGSRIVSLAFQIQRDTRKKERRLYLTLFIQQIVET